MPSTVRPSSAPSAAVVAPRDHVDRYPVAHGRPPMERHLRECRERGHSTWSRNGEDVGLCPRCGEVKA